MRTWDSLTEEERQAAIKGLTEFPTSTSIIDPEAGTELPPPSKTDGP